MPATRGLYLETRYFSANYGPSTARPFQLTLANGLANRLG